MGGSGYLVTAAHGAAAHREAGGDMYRPRRVKEPGNVNPYATALGHRDTA